ncbi:MAG: phosphopantothenoylcysteine decarboxylase [Atribacterota bacterium]
MVPNPDILFGLGQRKRNQVLVGFCAETDNPLTEAKRKLAKKNLDLMVANTVVKGESGFAVSTNKAWIVNRKGESIDCPIMDKVELAGLICDTVASLFPQ